MAGQGPPLVKAANWLNHLEYDWQSPIWSNLFRKLAGQHRLIRYDERGNGLSDRDVGDISFDAFVHDLECVVEAVGLNRFALLGISQGCAVSIVYAIRHPGRVESSGFAWRIRSWQGQARPRRLQDAAVTRPARLGTRKSGVQTVFHFDIRAGRDT